MLAVIALCSPTQHGYADAVDDNDPTYREQVRAALAAYDAGDLAKAHALFEEAHARYPNARALRGLGTVELEQQDYVSAATHLEQALASPELALSGPLRQETEAALSEANAHVARVLVLPSPADAEVQLDTRPVAGGASVVLVPGVYTITLTAQGYRSESRQLTVSPNQIQLIHWSLERVVAPAPIASVALASTRDPVAPRLLSGAGCALTLTGLALLAVGIHEYRQLGDANTYADWQDERQRFPKLAGLGGALAGAGALMAASGWWWRGHLQRQDVGVTLRGDQFVLHTRF
ncbi:MAG TPA: hypothetical protein VI299_15430 [Polyangiales bacterium]